MKNQKIVGIYLAAGESTRFGSNKLFATVENVPLGSFALLAALKSQLDTVVIITKKADYLKWLPNSFVHHFASKIKKVECEQSIKGQSYSLKCGLDTAMNIGARAVVIILADQPLISTMLINEIISCFKENRLLSFVGATYQGIISPPILFSSSMFSKLYELEGDTGARNLIRQELSKGCLIKMNNPTAFFDVDTKEDYVKLVQKITEK